jgi:hypothetical protein
MLDRAGRGLSAAPPCAYICAMMQEQSAGSAADAFGVAPRPLYERLFKRDKRIPRLPGIVTGTLGFLSLLCAGTVSSGVHPTLLRFLVWASVAIGPPLALERWWRERTRRSGETLIPELESAPQGLLPGVLGRVLDRGAEG